MLTFLRKIRRSLIETGSARKYILYAIGEIALVVIGILIALQLNNWNEERINRNNEKLLLNEIHKEFVFNKQELGSTLDAYDEVLKNCVALESSFPINPEIVNRDSISKLLAWIDLHGSADLSMGSISTLVNSSSFEIISDSELRTLLVQWEDLFSDYKDRETNGRSYTREILVPYLSERIPQPFHEGIKDERVDLSFLGTIKFENMIKNRKRFINMMLFAQGDDSKIGGAINRIILLSGESSN